MIVRQLPGRVRLITQPDHAHLSRQIMQHSASLRGRPRAESILLAIGEHDNGWEEEDGAPTLDLETGTVVDFVSAPLIVRHRVWPRAIGRLSYDPWAAALVAQHALTVYDRFRSDADWSTFFADLTVLRDAMLAASGGSGDELADDYPFVRLGDLISLTFCTGWTEPQRFAEWVVTGVGASVSVDPSPFDSSIAFEIPAVELPGAVFRSATEMERVFLAAPQTILSGEVVKPI
jgi:hypothetical protein